MGDAFDLYVLEHKTCGHVVGAANNRAQVEASRRQLQAGGYFRWRVRKAAAAEVDRVVADLIAGEACATCRIDPTRARLPGVAGQQCGVPDGAISIDASTLVDPGHVIMPGACLDNPLAIESMLQQTHDGLLEIVGPLACGPVEWRHWHGFDACWSKLQALYADDRRPIKAHGLDQFEAFFREHPEHCVLVVASCPVVAAPVGHT